jgi:hypothetical protein
MLKVPSVSRLIRFQRHGCFSRTEPGVTGFYREFHLDADKIGTRRDSFNYEHERSGLYSPEVVVGEWLK